MNTHTDTRTLSQAAIALGISPARFCWLMKRKGFEGQKGPRNSRLVTREDIQRALGRSVPDDAWEAVRDIKARPGKAEQQRRAMAKAAQARETLHDQIAPFDPGWVAAAVRQRDLAWERTAFAQGVEIKPPPFPDDFRPILGAQHVFTEADVAELVVAAIARRDESWNAWIGDSHERALHPSGPPAIGSDEFFSPKVAKWLAEAVQPIIDRSCKLGANNGHS